VYIRNCAVFSKTIDNFYFLCTCKTFLIFFSLCKQHINIIVRISKIIKIFRILFKIWTVLIQLLYYYNYIVYLEKLVKSTHLIILDIFTKRLYVEYWTLNKKKKYIYIYISYCNILRFRTFSSRFNVYYLWKVLLIVHLQMQFS